MATAEQLKAVLKSYIEGDGEQFLTVSMQVAASAAHHGQTRLAQELRDLIDEAKRKASQPLARPTVPLARPIGELAEYVQRLLPQDPPGGNGAFRGCAAVAGAAFCPSSASRTSSVPTRCPARRKLLLIGPPGSGKTMTAAALAGELKLPLLAVRLDGLITKYMGETAAKLRQVFDAMVTTRGVYLFDEFDAIGGDRARPNDVGGIRRVLNSFLQFLEADDSDSLILAATNHKEILDPALFRRFDDVIRYGYPSPEQVEMLVKDRLNSFDLSRVQWDKVRRAASSLSFAEVGRASSEAAKAAILEDRAEIETNQLLEMLRERAAINKDAESSSGGP